MSTRRITKDDVLTYLRALRLEIEDERERAAQESEDNGLRILTLWQRSNNPNKPPSVYDGMLHDMTTQIAEISAAGREYVEVPEPAEPEPKDDEPSSSRVPNKYMFCAGCKHNLVRPNEPPCIGCVATRYEAEETAEPSETLHYTTNKLANEMACYLSSQHTLTSRTTAISVGVGLYESWMSRIRTIGRQSPSEPEETAEEQAAKHQ